MIFKNVIIACLLSHFTMAIPGKYKKLKKIKSSWFSPNDVLSDTNELPLPSGILSTPELISYQGYPVEIHHVTTDDGYILEMHRIPYGRRGIATSSTRPPIFLQHCLLCSSSDWIMNTPEKALAYILADEGYDVWLGNVRGNTYSLKHVTLDTKDSDFWNFSWQEMGKYDAPAMVDYILYHTRHKQLTYLGFSMGTTIFFTMMNERPEYQEKIKFSVLLAPVAQINHLGGPLSSPPILYFIEKTLNLFSWHQILASGSHIDYLASLLCDADKITASVCHRTLFFLTGSNDEQLNKAYLPNILAHTPAGTSTKTFLHFLQVVSTGEFKQYDYGFFKNYDLYGWFHPPWYYLDNIKVPVAIFYSDNDIFAAPKDVKNVISQLPNVVHAEKIKDKKFTHLDFIWALDADKFLYRNIVNVLRKNRNNSTL